MIKSELIEKLGEAHPHLFQRDVERVVNTVLEEITSALESGDRVELRGFGAFSVRNRPPRQRLLRLLLTPPPPPPPSPMSLRPRVRMPNSSWRGGSHAASSPRCAAKLPRSL